MQLLKKAKRTYLLLAAVDLLLGLCLIVWPRISASALCVIAGILLLAAGAVDIALYFNGDSYGVPFGFNLASGLFSALLGVVLLLNPANAALLLPIFVGVFVILDAAFTLQVAIDLKRAGISRWWTILLLSAVSFIMGALLLFNPFAGETALMLFMGITLVADAVENIWTVCYTARMVKKSHDSGGIYINL